MMGRGGYDELGGAAVAEAEVAAQAWLDEVGAALGVAADEVLPESVRAEILGLTGEIAHHVVRLAVPWTSYLIGVAVGRGASPAEALRIVRGLLEDTAASESRGGAS
jgi:Domain of unknown function (DUF6457)